MRNTQHTYGDVSVRGIWFQNCMDEGQRWNEGRQEARSEPRDVHTIVSQKPTGKSAPSLFFVPASLWAQMKALEHHDMTTVVMLGTNFQLGKKWWEHMKNPLLHDLSFTVLRFWYKLLWGWGKRLQKSHHSFTWSTLAHNNFSAPTWSKGYSTFEREKIRIAGISEHLPPPHSPSQSARWKPSVLYLPHKSTNKATN